MNKTETTREIEVCISIMGANCLVVEVPNDIAAEDVRDYVIENVRSRNIDELKSDCEDFSVMISEIDGEWCDEDVR